MPDDEGGKKTTRGPVLEPGSPLAEAMAAEPLRDLRKEIRAFKSRLADLRGKFSAAREADEIFAPPGWLGGLRKDVEAAQSGLAALAEELAEVPNRGGIFGLSQQLKDLRRSMDAGPTFMDSLRKEFGFPSSLSPNFQTMFPGVAPGFFGEPPAPKKSLAKPQEAKQAPRPTPVETSKARPSRPEDEPPSASLAEAEEKREAVGEKFCASLKGVDVRLAPLRADLRAGVVSSEAAERLRRSVSVGVNLPRGFVKFDQCLTELGDMLQETFGPRKFEQNLPYLPARIGRSENKA